MNGDVTIEYLRTLVKGVDEGRWNTDEVFERLRQTIDSDRLEGTRPWRELVDSGLLWYLNRTALWPRGYTLSLVYDADGTCLGWGVDYEGEPITTDHETENDRFEAVERTLKELQ